MIRIGLTGGIGSGKSTMATLLGVMGVPVYDADAEGRRLTEMSPAIRKELTRLLGEWVYSGGRVDRRGLASRIFSDPVMLERVNAIIHPRVGKDFLDWVSLREGDVCAIESAILFESGFNNFVDTTVMVYAPKEIRIERAMTRPGACREDVVRRISRQWPEERKASLSDHIIYNDGRRAVIPQAIALLEGLGVYRR
ncbi:MAG: dephospho-CoA kinase [Tannerellaceae bacterium]|jgi:dephospho-CoA kinase|nr:dephospho-CoA kinase [Tannerellaceae bacterium]